MKRVSSNSLRVGEPLPFNCYDVSGILLLRGGQLISTQRQLDFLLERGLYCEPENSGSASTPRAVEEQPTIHERYALLKDKVKRLHLGLAGEDLGERDDSPSGGAPQESLLERLRRARAELVRELQPGDEGGNANFVERILRLATEIQAMCAEDADATLAAIHIDHEGSYGVFHAIQRALMCELVSAAEIASREERLSVVCAALTADLSMFALQDRLYKQNTPLNAEQRGQIHRHPLETSIRLYEVGVKDESWINGVLHHHERLDGSGYPFGLRGEGIAYAARLLAIADIYAAMIAARADRDTRLPKAALREIFLQRGNSVDARTALTFVKELGIFPPGSFVRLHNSEIAVVVKRGQNAKCPLVKSVIGPRGALLDRPLARDTADSEFEIMDMIPREKSVSLEWKRLWN